MIPIRITLKNFLSYGASEQAISFQGHSLICLSGKNGNGKSALLDAMTWAVWGQARKTTGVSKPDDGLLRLGTTQMVVQFEFIFNGVQYKVRREFYKTNSKPYAVLEFAVFDAEKDEYVSLSDKTIRKTQDKIENTILLDYETFVNSSFLKQGSANEFSRKSPKERKKILAGVLGLHKYDQMQSAALEKARGFQQERRVLEELMASDLSFIEKKPEITEQHAGVAKELVTFRAQRDAVSEQLAALDEQFQHMQRGKKAREDLQRRVAQQSEQVSGAMKQWHTAASQWRLEHAQLCGLPSADSIQKLVLELTEKESALQKKQAEQFSLKEELFALQTKEQEFRQAVQARMREQLDVLQKKLHEIRAQRAQQQTVIATAKNEFDQFATQADVLTKERATLKDQLISAQKLITDKKEQAAQFEKRKQFYSMYRQKANWLHSQLKEFEQRHGSLASQDEASCPLCEQLVTAKRKAFLLTSLQKEQHRLHHTYQRLCRVVTSLKEILVTQHEEVALLAKTEQHVISLTTKLDALQEKLQAATVQRDAAEKKCQDGTTLLQALERDDVATTEQIVAVEKGAEQQLQGDAEFASLLTRKKEIDEQLASSSQSVTELEAVRVDLQAANKKLAVVREQSQHAAVLHERLIALHDKKLHIRSLQVVEQDLEKQLAEHGHDAEAEQAVMTKHAAKKSELQELEKQGEQLLARSAKLEQVLEDIAQREDQHKDKQSQIKAVDKDIWDYQKLGALWGKNGIQALLIEEAIPEIEEEANRLLSRLTNNQAQIFIESLRDLKKGGVRETLDIKISDTMGIRPYEMFSGGEAFRIDFSLRIAISKLLARRAGASLQLLIIDEGFGSQDEEGLQRLMDVMHAIQNDFEKIIVVSHLPEFKENFPVHFIVDKQAQGSVVNVEMRG